MLETSDWGAEGEEVTGEGVGDVETRLEIDPDEADAAAGPLARPLPLPLFLLLVVKCLLFLRRMARSAAALSSTVLILYGIVAGSREPPVAMMRFVSVSSVR